MVALTGCLGPKGEAKGEAPLPTLTLFMAEKGEFEAAPLPEDWLIYTVLPISNNRRGLGVPVERARVLLSTRRDRVPVRCAPPPCEYTPGPPARAFTVTASSPALWEGSFDLRKLVGQTIYAQAGDTLYEVRQGETPQALNFQGFVSRLWVRREDWGVVPPEACAAVATFLQEHYAYETVYQGPYSFYRRALQSLEEMVTAWRKDEGLGPGGLDAKAWMRLQQQLPKAVPAERWMSLRKVDGRTLELCLKNPTSRPLWVEGRPLFFLDQGEREYLSLPGPILLAPGESRTLTVWVGSRKGAPTAPRTLTTLFRTLEGLCRLDVTLELPQGCSFFDKTCALRFEVLPECPPGVTPEPLPEEVLRVALVTGRYGNVPSVPAVRLSTSLPRLTLSQGDTEPLLVRFGDQTLRTHQQGGVTLSGEEPICTLDIVGDLPPEDLDRPTEAEATFYLRDLAGKVWVASAKRTYVPLDAELRECLWQQREAKLKAYTPEVAKRQR